MIEDKESEEIDIIKSRSNLMKFTDHRKRIKSALNNKGQIDESKREQRL